MKRMILGVLVLVILALGAHAADSVSPATCTFTNFRGEAIAQAGALSYYKGSTVLFTNCIVYSGGTTSAGVQGLDGVEVQVTIGTVASSVIGTGTVGSAAGGSWWYSTTVPTNYINPYLQIKVTDGSGNSYIYPWKVLATSDPLD